MHSGRGLLRGFSCFLTVFSLMLTASSAVCQTIDTIAEKMLLYQRSYGGWPQYHGDATDYRLPIDAARKEKLLADKTRRDATIDDHSTTAEIRYLLKAYEQIREPRYLAAAELGIAYLLKAQNTAGGWPQFYPDSSGYRIHITYNDNAMIDVMWIIKGIRDRLPLYYPVADSLRERAVPAFDRGVECILNTQVVQHGVKTVWCAQHDSKTLAPAQARAFEPPSLSGSESVGIVRLLMDIDKPSPEIKEAIEAAVAWFREVSIPGYTVEFVRDSTLPRGVDRVIRPEEGSTIWARFYQLDTFKPIFSGRDSEIHYALSEIENERRVGYAFYGKWPQSLIEVDYPEWRARWGGG